MDLWFLNDIYGADHLVTKKPDWKVVLTLWNWQYIYFFISSLGLNTQMKFKCSLNFGFKEKKKKTGNLAAINLLKLPLMVWKVKKKCADCSFPLFCHRILISYLSWLSLFLCKSFFDSSTFFFLNCFVKEEAGGKALWQKTLHYEYLHLLCHTHESIFPLLIEYTMPPLWLHSVQSTVITTPFSES